MARTDLERRRFITRHDVEDAAAAGRPIVVRGRDTITDEAAQRARDLGVAVEREGSPATTSRPPQTGSGGPAATAPVSGPSEEQLRRAVRAAVVAELGHTPADLDAAIDRVMARRR